MTPNWILTATSSSGYRCYLIRSATQGDKMLSYAYSIATRFDTMQQARKNIKGLSKKYKGLTNWKALKVIV